MGPRVCQVQQSGESFAASGETPALFPRLTHSIAFGLAPLLQPYLPPSCPTHPLKPHPLLFLVLLTIHHVHPLCYIHDTLPTFSLTYLRLTCSLRSHPLFSHSTLVLHPPTPLLPSCPTHWCLFTSSSVALLYLVLGSDGWPICSIRTHASLLLHQLLPTHISFLILTDSLLTFPSPIHLFLPSKQIILTHYPLAQPIH